MSSFLVPDFPNSKSGPANNQNLAPIFGNDKKILALSSQIKSGAGNEESFFNYLQAIKDKGDLPVVTEYTNPFLKKHSQITNESCYAEIAFTIWNFICFLINKTSTKPVSSQEDLLKIKPILQDLNALVEDLKFISTKLRNHSLFSQGFTNFVESFVNFMNAQQVFQIAIFKQIDNYILRSGGTLLDQLSHCLKTLGSLGNGIEEYFRPEIKALIQYFNGYLYYRASLVQIKESSYGNAISSLRAASRILKTEESSKSKWFHSSAKNDDRLTLSVKNAKDSLITKIESSLKREETNNRSMYAQVIPDDPPSLPAPYKLNLFDPTPALLLFCTVEIPGAPQERYKLPSAKQTQQSLPQTSQQTQSSPQANQQNPQLQPQTSQNNQFPQQLNQQPQFSQQLNQQPQFSPNASQNIQFPQQQNQQPQFSPNASQNIQFLQQQNQHPQFTQQPQFSPNSSQNIQFLQQQNQQLQFSQQPQFSPNSSQNIQFLQQQNQHPQFSQQPQFSPNASQNIQFSQQQNLQFSQMVNSQPVFTQQAPQNIQYSQQLNQHPQFYQQTNQHPQFIQQTNQQLQFSQQLGQHPYSNSQPHYPSMPINAQYSPFGSSDAFNIQGNPNNFAPPYNQYPYQNSNQYLNIPQSLPGNHIAQTMNGQGFAQHRTQSGGIPAYGQPQYGSPLTNSGSSPNFTYAQQPSFNGPPAFNQQPDPEPSFGSPPVFVPTAPPSSPEESEEQKPSNNGLPNFSSTQQAPHKDSNHPPVFPQQGSNNGPPVFTPPQQGSNNGPPVFTPPQQGSNNGPPVFTPPQQGSNNGPPVFTPPQQGSNNGPPVFTPPQQGSNNGPPVFTPPQQGSNNGPPVFTPPQQGSNNGPPVFTPPPQGSSNGPPVFTPPQDSDAKPPAFNQKTSGPPAFTPTDHPPSPINSPNNSDDILSSTSTNASGNPLPTFSQTNLSGPPAYTPPDQLSDEQLFPQMAKLSDLKQDVAMKIVDLSNSADDEIMKMVNMYAQQLSEAAVSDGEIDKLIQQYKQPGHSGIQSELIEKAISGAIGFYTQINEQLMKVKQHM